MTKKEQQCVYSELKSKALKINHFFGRKLITVRHSDFVAWNKYFTRSFNIFNKKENFRSSLSAKHIHAIRDGNLVELHYDYINPDRDFLFAAIHFFIDASPYFLWRLLTRKYSYPHTINKNH